MDICKHLYVIDHYDLEFIRKDFFQCKHCKKWFTWDELFNIKTK